MLLKLYKNPEICIYIQDNINCGLRLPAEASAQAGNVDCGTQDNYVDFVLKIKYSK